MAERGIAYERQVDLPVRYKSVDLDARYRIDLLIEGVIVIELKSVDQVTPVHEAQLITYLKLARKPVGLLINFNIDLLKNGIHRRVI